jgi:hydrogenase-1 operon protein HyaF
MKPFPFPVRVSGAGSQPEGDEVLQYLAMPSEMSTFRMPRVPDAAPPGAMAVAREVLAMFARLLDGASQASLPPLPLDLAYVPHDARKVLNEVLGEGEVAVRIDGRQQVRIQESVFTGVWRVCTFDERDTLIGDWLEASPVPAIVVDAARARTSNAIAPVEMPRGTMNAPSLLAEIGAAMASRTSGAPAHVLNLTLFPLSPEDQQVLERALPVGGVAIMSRGFGQCRISSTLARDVWRVQYFNSMSTLILDTIEVVEVPDVAVAAPEDLADSRERLAELLEWMGEACTA